MLFWPMKVAWALHYLSESMLSKESWKKKESQYCCLLLAVKKKMVISKDTARGEVGPFFVFARETSMYAGW